MKASSRLLRIAVELPVLSIALSVLVVGLTGEAWSWSPMRRPPSELVNIPWLIPHVIAIVICLYVAVGLFSIFYERYKMPLSQINKKKLLAYGSVMVISLVAACCFTSDNTRLWALQWEKQKAEQGSQKSALILGIEYYYDDHIRGNSSVAKDAYYWLSIADEMFKLSPDLKEKNTAAFYRDNARSRLSPEEANLIDNKVKNWISVYQGAGN